MQYRFTPQTILFAKGRLLMNGQDRLYEKKWGVFCHYLSGIQNGNGELNTAGKITPWSDCTEDLDTDRLARSLHEIGAGYFFFTIMQGGRYLCAPNSVYDSICGTKPGEACSKRDVIEDLYNSLSVYGIDLYLYYTGDGPHADAEFGPIFGIDTETRFNPGVSEDFVGKWASVLEEYAVRYGDKVKGWWIDGCYKEYFHYTDDLLAYYYNACKKGNPDAIVSCNNGVKPDYEKCYIGEDFVCGEFNDFRVIPKSRFIDGAQAHMLAPLGVSQTGNEWDCWAKNGCKRSGEYMRSFVECVHSAGGVVTIDIPLYRDGHLNEEQLNELKKING